MYVVHLLTTVGSSLEIFADFHHAKSAGLQRAAEVCLFLALHWLFHCGLSEGTGRKKGREG